MIFRALRYLRPHPSDNVEEIAAKEDCPLVAEHRVDLHYLAIISHCCSIAVSFEKTFPRNGLYHEMS